MVSLPGPSFWTFRKPASYSSLESLQHHVSKATLISYFDCVRGPTPSHRWNFLHRCASRVWEDACLFTNARSSMDHPHEGTTCIRTYLVRLSQLASRLPSPSIRSIDLALKGVPNAPLWEFVNAPPPPCGRCDRTWTKRCRREATNARLRIDTHGWRRLTSHVDV